METAILRHALELFHRFRRMVSMLCPRWRSAAAAITGLGAVACCSIYFANAVIVHAAKARTFIDPATVPRRYAIIVLGARVNGDDPTDVLADRLATALAAYHAGRGHRILVSGDHGRANYDEANAMRRWLLDRGVPAADVFMDHAGFRTLDTMVRAKKVFGVEGAIVVTQEFHLARALYLADAMKLDAVGLIADRRTYDDETNYAVREVLARFMCWIDVHVLDRQPKYLGPKLPITGSTAKTYD